MGAEPIAEEYINRLTFKPTPPTTARPQPPPPPPQRPYEEDPNFQPSSSGLYMLGPNNVLIPVNNVNPYDLFGPDHTTTTRRPTTTTTTQSPPRSNEKIYILGPKGSLIPLDALGIRKPFGHSGHETSSYNKWLRGMLMGEIEAEEYDDEFLPYVPGDEEESKH